MSDIASLEFLVLGDAAVGKSSLVRRWTGGNSAERLASPSKTSTGAFLSFVELMIDGRKVAVTFWEINIPAMNRNMKIKINLFEPLFRHADGCFVVYDITDESSFNNISSWAQCYYDMSGKRINADRHPLIMVANKCDLGRRSVSGHIAVQLAEKLRSPYFEVSAHQDNEAIACFHKTISMFLLMKGGGTSPSKGPQPNRMILPWRHDPSSSSNSNSNSNSAPPAIVLEKAPTSSSAPSTVKVRGHYPPPAVSTSLDSCIPSKTSWHPSPMTPARATIPIRYQRRNSWTSGAGSLEGSRSTRSSSQTSCSSVESELERLELPKVQVPSYKDTVEQLRSTLYEKSIANSRLERDLARNGNSLAALSERFRIALEERDQIKRELARGRRQVTDVESDILFYSAVPTSVQVRWGRESAFFQSPEVISVMVQLSEPCPKLSARIVGTFSLYDTLEQQQTLQCFCLQSLESDQASRAASATEHHFTCSLPADSPSSFVGSIVQIAYVLRLSIEGGQRIVKDFPFLWQATPKYEAWGSAPPRQFSLDFSVENMFRLSLQLASYPVNVANGISGTLLKQVLLTTLAYLSISLIRKESWSSGGGGGGGGGDGDELKEGTESAETILDVQEWRNVEAGGSMAITMPFLLEFTDMLIPSVSQPADQLGRPWTSGCLEHQVASNSINYHYLLRIFVQDLPTGRSFTRSHDILCFFR